MKLNYKLLCIPIILVIIGIIYVNVDDTNYSNILDKTVNSLEKKTSSTKEYVPFQRKKIEIYVNRVVDGDTFISNHRTYRLILVDTPETKHPRMGVQPYGIEASNYTKKKLEHRKINIEYDIQKTDRYGRDLVYVWSDNKLYNADLVENGYARVLTVAPNTRYLDKLKILEIQARRENKGLWKYERYK
ncbi:thermonuclease family protein [Macrococcus capreoli]